MTAVQQAVRRQARVETFSPASSARPTMLLAAGLAIAAVVAGGSSHAAGLTMFVRLAAIPLLMVAVHQRLHHPDSRSAAAAAPLALLAAAIVLPLVQLVPLPPELWTRLPGRAAIASAYRAAEVPLPNLPLSLAPSETINAALGLVPPAAMLLAVLGLDAAERLRLLTLFVALALASVALGAMQLAGGDLSPLRFHSITNKDAAVGLFANRNHQASFLAALIPLTAALAVGIEERRRRPGLVAPLLAAAIVLVLALGVAITRSRAGVLLLAPALLSCVVIGAVRRRPHGRLSRSRPWLALSSASAIVAALALVVAFQLTPLAARFVEGEQTRLLLARRTAEAASQYLPFGAGLGAFERVYQVHEPQESLGPFVFNHAHNDVLELWLEAGVPGAVLLGLFLVWWSRAGLAAIRRSDVAGRALGLGAAAATAMLMMHSLVDYPLRTGAGSVLFAFCCGLLVLPEQTPTGRHWGRARSMICESQKSLAKCQHIPSNSET